MSYDFIYISLKKNIPVVCWSPVHSTIAKPHLARILSGRFASVFVCLSSNDRQCSVEWLLDGDVVPHWPNPMTRWLPHPKVTVSFWDTKFEKQTRISTLLPTEWVSLASKLSWLSIRSSFISIAVVNISMAFFILLFSFPEFDFMRRIIKSEISI